MLFVLDEAVVVGAGGFGRVTLDVVGAHNAAHPDRAIQVVGVADDDPSAQDLRRLHRLGHRYLGTTESVVSRLAPIRVLVAIGSPGTRRAMAAHMEDNGFTPGSVVHPSATIGAAMVAGAGLIVCAGVDVSTGVTLGRHVHLNPRCTVGHDTVLSDFVSINPAAVVSGDVDVGAEVLLGAGSVVLQGRRVGQGAVVGASACVTRDVAPGTTVVGVPARPHTAGLQRHRQSSTTSSASTEES